MVPEIDIPINTVDDECLNAQKASEMVPEINDIDDVWAFVQTCMVNTPSNAPNTYLCFKTLGVDNDGEAFTERCIHDDTKHNDDKTKFWRKWSGEYGPQMFLFDKHYLDMQYNTK
eukprot:506112_1